MRLNDGLHTGNGLVRYAVRILRFRREILAAGLCNALLETGNACLGGGVALYAHDADGCDLVPALFLCGFYRSLAAERGQLLIVEADKAENFIRVNRGVDRHNGQVCVCDLSRNGFRLQGSNDHCIAVARAKRGFDHGKLLIISGLRACADDIDRHAQILACFFAAVADILPVFGCQRFENDLDVIILLCGVAAGSLRGAAAAACQCTHQHCAGYQRGK